MIYVDAVVPDEGPVDDHFWARPATVLWMMEEILQRDSDEERLAYRKAAKASKRTLAKLVESWGITYQAWLADTTREPLRDETWPAWLDFGAVRKLPGVPRSSPIGTWALTESFADLFDPSLVGDPLDRAIEKWRGEQMDTATRVRVQLHRQREEADTAVNVRLPNGQTRSLAAGDASLIIKGVVEQWAPRKLREPVVLTISEPGDKYFVGDKVLMERLGLHIDVNSLLPDVLLVDIGLKPVVFWVVEAVATDGPVSEARRNKLEKWAQDENIKPESCRFMSAFISRDSGPARNNLKDLAIGTYAWYADEPTRELEWHELPPPSPRPNNVSPLRRNS